MVGLTLEVVVLVVVTAGYDDVDMVKVRDAVERGAEDEVVQVSQSGSWVGAVDYLKTMGCERALYGVYDEGVLYVYIGE